MMRTAPRARFSAGPARPSWPWSPAPAAGWTLHHGQEVRGFCFGLSPPPHFFHFPVLFVSSALGVGGCYNLLAFRLPLDWTQLRAEEQEGKPLHMPPTHMPASTSLEGSDLPRAGWETRAEAVFKDCPTLQLAAGRGVDFQSKG